MYSNFCSDNRPQEHIGHVQYEKIDLDRTYEANRVPKNNRSITPRIGNQTPIRRPASNEDIYRPDSPPRGHYMRGNAVVGPTEYHPEDDLARLNGPRAGSKKVLVNESLPTTFPVDGPIQRERASFDNLNSVERSQGGNDRAFANRLKRLDRKEHEVSR